MIMERVGDATLYTGDVLAVLREMEAESAHCVVTSPPYYALRDYGVPGQIGLEENPEAYIAKMVEVFREVRRVLRSDGTLWLNIGDSYAGSGKGPSGNIQGEASCGVRIRSVHGESGHTSGVTPPEGYKAKDLMGIPWMLAFALRADGWYLRSDIIWSKPNPMPESVTDRPTKAHEYLFLLSRSARYFYDAEAIREPAQIWTGQAATFDRDHGKATENLVPGQTHAQHRVRKPAGWDTGAGAHGSVHRDGRAKEIEYTEGGPAGRNRRTVWTIATEPYPEAHFATFPRKLVQPCILAGCPEHACPKCGAPWEKQFEHTPMVFKHSAREEAKHAAGLVTALHGTLVKPAENRVVGEHPTCDCSLPPIGGIVLDPFGGSGTTAEVALEYGRRAILIELNPEYVELQKRRLAPVAGRPLLDFVGGTWGKQSE